MKTLYPLRRRDESAWSAYVTHRTAGIEREHRRKTIEGYVLGAVLFCCGAGLLCKPFAYFVARLCQ